MAPAHILWLLLGISFSMLKVDAGIPSSPEEALLEYTDHCLGNPPSEDTCCNRMGLNVDDGDAEITASSSWPTSTTHGMFSPIRAALFEVAESVGIAGWAAGNNTLLEWIQVDFKTPRTITGVLLQGRGASSQWVESFRVTFSEDGETFTSTPELEGTFDRDSVSRRMFDQPIRARYFRINPLTWKTHISLRFDLLGCRE